MTLAPEHVEALRLLTAPFYSPARLALYQANGMTTMRYRWDGLYMASKPVVCELMQAIYQYANDTHVDAALRQLSGTK